jgi:hypothetical protein
LNFHAPGVIFSWEKEMRRSLTVQIEEAVLDEAAARAQQQHRSLTEYIEALLRRDLDIASDSGDVEVFAPKDIREYQAVPKDDETQEQTDLADRALQRILDRTGH